MFGFGVQELVIVFLIVMILFGAKRLPELADGMGRAIKNFKRASAEEDNIHAITAGNEKKDQGRS